jgi:hypothetical protein
MNKTHSKRVLRLAEHLDTLPPTPAFVEEAFARFRTTGELPEAVRLAEAVVGRVLRDEAEDTEPISPMADILARLIREGKVTLPPGPPPPPRGCSARR